MTKFPEITVELTSDDGNAFAVLGKARRAMKDAGWSEAQRAEFLDEATGGDYHHLLSTTMEWFTVDFEDLSGEEDWDDEEDEEDWEDEEAE